MTKFAVRSLASIVFALVIAVCVLLVRVAIAPLSVDAVRPSVEEALNREGADFSIKMRNITMHWPDLRGPLLLRLHGGEIYDKGQTLVASVDEIGLALNKPALLIGQVVPEGVVLEGPSLRVIRREDNSFDFGLGMDLGSNVYGPAAPDKEGSDELLKTVLAALSGEGDEHSVLSNLKNFTINHARLEIDDKVLKSVWNIPEAYFLFIRESEGVRLVSSLQLPSIEDDEGADRSTLNAQIIFNKERQDFEVMTELSAFPLALVAKKVPEFEMLAGQSVLLEGRVKASLDHTLKVKDAYFDLLAPQGDLKLEALSSGALDFSDLNINAEYDGATGVMTLNKAQVKLNGRMIEAGADLVMNDGEVRGPVRLTIPYLEQRAIAPLWPKALKGDNSEDWVVKKLSGGVFSNMFAQGDLVLRQGDEGWDADFESLLAGFDFENMDVDYRAPLWPVSGAKGRGRFNMDTQTLRIDIEQASLKDMRVKKAELEFIDIIAVGAGNADIHVELEGPLKSALGYIAVEPIGVKPDFDAVNASGHADLKVNVQFPTVDDIPKEAVKIDVRGVLSKANIPNVVKGMALSGGPYDLTVADNKLTVKGKGALDGRGINFSYNEFLNSEGQAYSSRLNASLQADEALRRKFGIDLSTFMSGPADVNVVYTKFSNGRSEAEVDADLNSSKLYIEPFDYVKNPGQAGQAKLKAVLVKEVLKEVRDLTGSAPGFKLEKSRLGFRGSGANTELSSGNVSRFVVGETIANGEFEIDQRGVVRLVMNGSFFDLRPFLDNDGKQNKAYEGPAMKISIAADRMRTANEEVVQYGKMYVDIDKSGSFNQLEMDAIAGGGDLYLRFKPDGSGKRVFRFEADNAGAALKAFDLYKNMRGGKLVIYGEPIDNVYDRNLIGKAEIRDFKVVNAPSLARLLGIMSLPGLMQSLNGEGLFFTKMEADFDWRYRQNGSLLVLKNGATSGNSLGLTFDGTFDNASGALDVSGTVIPLSGINKAIGSIPLIGDIITGGTGALIAATYTMKADAGDKEPSVSVNPLSVLTPGILRRVLFEGD